MKLWLIVVQGDDKTWIEDAWDDDSIAESHAGWQEAVDKARKLAYTNGYELRILPVTVPGIYEAFKIPILKGALLAAPEREEGE